MLRQNKPRLEPPDAHHQWVSVKSRQHVAPVVESTPQAPASQTVVQPVAQPVAAFNSGDIESLRAAYQTVLVSDALSNLRVTQSQPVLPQKSSFLNVLKQQPNAREAKKPISLAALQSESVQLEPGQPDSEPSLLTPEMTLADIEAELANKEINSSPKKSWFGRLFNRPTGLVSLSIGLCLAASAAYAGLGYWLLMSDNPSQAAETVNMVNVGEEHVKENAATGLDNLRKLQEQSQGGIVLPAEENPPEPEALNMLAVAAKSPLDNIVPGLPKMQKEMVGRPDPFSPLLQDGVDNTPTVAQPKDVLDDVMFTGFIGDVNAKDKVAIIQVANGAVPQTLVKKAGEAIVIDGEQIFLKSITKDAVILSVHGKQRRLALNPYVDTTANPGNASADPANSAVGGTTGGAAKSGAATASSNPANPTLAEPDN